MKAKALGRLLTAALLSSAVVFVSITGKAQIPTPTANWVNIKDPKFGAIGDGSHDDTAAIQAAIDYAFANNLPAVYCPAGKYKTTSTLYLDPPGNLRTNPSNPPLAQFTMAFFGDPVSGSVHLSGCILQPSFNNAIAFVVGTGQSMRVSDIAVVGPNNAYRANLDPNGVGIGIGSGSGGAATTLIENTYVRYFYVLYKTAAMGNGSLSEGNTFRNVGGDDGYVGISLSGPQAYVNDIVEPRLGSVTIGIDSEYSKQVNVFGGNISATTSASNSFGISSTSSLYGGCGGWCFTTFIGSPDQYAGTVYDSYMIVTAHFGVIPLVMQSWNPATNVATFGFWLPWLWNNYGRSSQVPYSGIGEDIQAAAILYAAERVEVARGLGIVLDGIHVENPNACTSLLVASEVWGGQVSNEIRNPYFNYDISVPQDASVANKYCQQSFPFIQNGVSGATLKLRGGNYSAATNPIILEVGIGGQQIEGSLLDLSAFNIRVHDYQGHTYGQIAQQGNDATNYYQFETVARGAGRWDRSYFLPSAASASTLLQTLLTDSELTTDYCGYEPCPWTTPNLSPTLYSLVNGTLGALGTYPPIACRTVFKSVDWDTRSLSHPFLRSASCPGYSWGQNLTDATVGETVTWSYMAGSDVVYLGAKTLQWMFPGLGISLDAGNGAQPYIVTGVYPSLGYVTVIWAGSNSGGPLQGSARTAYSCSSSCTIGQAPFSWTAY